MARSNTSSAPETGTARVVLKKYGKNRRLYDTSAKRYVNLDEFASMVRKGIDVQVVDAKTGEDLTRVCLMQVIMEDTKERPTGLPLELLRQLVVASDHVGREFIMWYLQSAFDTYNRLQGALETGVSGLHAAATNPFQLVRNLITPAAVENHETASDEIAELRRRIAELESRQKNASNGVQRKRRAKKAAS